MKRVTGRAWFSVICISGLLAAGIAVPSAFGTSEAAGPNGASADGSRNPASELKVARARSDSARISRPSDRRGPNTLKDADVTLSSYDAKAGRAVLSQKDRGGSTDGIDVREGDVIASPPTDAAPEGALVKVRKVRSQESGKAELRTSRTNLAEVLGGAKADGQVPVSSSAWKVDPQVQGLEVARNGAESARGTTGPGKESQGAGTRGSDLRFDFDTELPGPDEGEIPGTVLDGSLEVSPEVDFSYDGNGSDDPAEVTASVGIGTDYKASWRVKGTVEADFDRRLPLAEATAHPVIMVGPVPVVVTVKLSLVAKVKANGQVQVDVDQDATGSVKVGTRYSDASGWEPESSADGETLPGGTVDVSGKGELRTAVGPEANVSLYDTVGVVAFIGPYLRATGEFTDGAQGGGQWKLYGGLTLESSLFAQLPFVIIGNRPSKHIDFPSINREWFITEGKFPAGT
ncbi:hypothetical protein GCM10012287_41620 [Streptomyces daqingensis]|uniref:Uncharacterized protein n=1 Tax=Streptomyces daqingensis TaxID=1472640 RepID=A0ABQ2MPJ3_9ACTN|nr:hypothetical protein [Streptomyces daqingensis]GGO53907.1 hypothetical protein GCM10012287_41620 [Streptomyces daqingensis]